jgi:hypothetical protein
MFSDTIRPVLLSPSSIETFSTSLCADMDIPLYPPGASTGTSTDDTSTLGLSSPSVSASGMSMKREHSAVTERKGDTREGSESKNKDSGNSRDKECDKEGDRDRRVERDRERDGGVSVGVNMNKEKAVSRYCSLDSPAESSMKSSPYVKSESVDTYQAPSAQNNRYLKASSYSEDYTDSTHISLDNNDGSESVSCRMDQLIQETELLKLADLESAQDKQKRIVGQGQLARLKASRFPEMESKYGTPIEAAVDLDYSYTTALASSKSSNALRRVSFGAADCASVPRPRPRELRVQDRMLAKLLQSKEVEVGSIKQLMNLGNFQAQMMGSRSGVRSMRRRLEEVIVQQRGAYEGVAASQSTKSRRAVSALAYLRSPAPSPFVSPRRHSTSSGLLTLDQRMLGDMMGHMAETPALEVPSFNPLFDPSRYTVAAIASYAACNSRPVAGAAAGAGEGRGSAVSGKDSCDSRAVSASVSRSGTRWKASKSSGGIGSSSPLGHASRSKAASRPVSNKFKLIRELADLARKQSEESIRTNGEDAEGFTDHLYTITVPSSAYPSSSKRHSSCSTSSLASAASSSSMGSPSRGSHNRDRAQDCVESFPVSRVCEEGGEGAEELREGQHADAAYSMQLQENRKKYQFWFKVVQMLNIKNLMSARVADQLEEARVWVRKGHVVAANRIGVCYLRYFKRRMNRLMAVYRRDHKAAKRPIRLMVIPPPHPRCPYYLSLIPSFYSLFSCFLFF